MSLRFRYRLQPIPVPATSLGGRFVRPRPLVTVSLIGPTGSQAVEALLDTGADDTVFHENIAMAIGLDLANAPRGTSHSATSTPVPVRYGQVTLRLTDGREYREWPAWVAFSSVKTQFALLGFAGVLQFFTAVFRGDVEDVELSVNSLYPGT